MCGIIIAALINLAPGINNVGQSGEVIAVNAATAEATANVNLQKVSTLTTYTNIVDEVVSYETAYAVKIPFECEAVTNENDYFSYEVSNYANIWTLKKDMLWQPNVTTSDAGTTYTLASEHSDFAPLRFNGEPLYSGEAANQIMSVAIPNETKLTSVYMVPWAKVAGGAESNSYWVVTHGSDYPSAIIFPAGTVLTSKKSFDPATDMSVSKVGSFSFDGATITNVVGYVDWDAFKDTNGVQRIIGEPVRFDMATTNEVVTGQAIANVYTATNDLATVTTANHFGSVVTNGYLAGEAIVVTGAADGDRISILTK